jgi:hypothetical protein
MLYQYIGYNLVVCLSLLSWVTWMDPGFWWIVGIYLGLGWFMGRRILEGLRWHHMMDLGDMTDLKVKGLFTWPILYLKIYFIFFIAAHC